MAELEVRGVTVSYGTDDPVLVDADVHVASGRMHALLGPSGSGKTTLLRAVAGFVEPSAGQIVLGGRNLSGVDPAKRGIGVVFQSYALFPHLDVTDNVGFGLAVRRVSRDERRRRIREVLELVGLTGFEHRRPAQLSGGQQQRVALARALVIEPELLLLDEPLSALDRKIRGEVQRELKRIHRRTGVTAVIVTHDQEEALFLADELSILEAGRVRQTGPPMVVYDEPADPFIAGFLGSTNLVEVGVVRRDEALYAVVGDGEVAVPGPDPGGQSALLSVRPERLRVLPRENASAPSAVAMAGRIAQVEVTGPVAQVRVTLEADGTRWQAATWAQQAATLVSDAPVWLELDPAGLRLFALESTGPAS